jgi:hypothetical protein
VAAGRALANHYVADDRSGRAQSVVPCFAAERIMDIGPIQNRFLNALGYTTEDPIREAREMIGPMSPNGWRYRGHTIYIQTHARLEFAHPLVRELFAPFLEPDWDCNVDGKLVGLYLASPVFAKNNGTAFVPKQLTQADQAVRGRASDTPQVAQLQA